MKKTLTLLLLLVGFTLDAQAETLTWNGTQGRMTWDFEDTNWLQGETSAKYTDGTEVVFGDNGSGEVTLADTFAPGSVLVNSDNDYTFTGKGKLTGEGTTLTKSGSGTLTINTANDYTGGTFINGGTLVLGNDSTLGQGEITVTGHGIISGEVDPTAVGIAGHATAEFTKPVSTELVRFSAAQGETVKVINNGDTTIKYEGNPMTLGGDVVVQAKTLEVITNESPVVFMHAVDVDEIVIADPETNLAFGNAELLDLNTLTMPEESYLLVMYTAEDRSIQRGTVTIKETLNAGSASLDANLMFVDANLQDGLSPLFNVNGGGDNALMMRNQFGIAEGTLVTLDSVTIAALEDLTDGQSLNLIIRADDVDELSYFGNYNGMSYDQLFSRKGGVVGDYTVYANAGAFGLIKGSNIPEPTTGTLSLLALAGLAARRRRK